MGNLDFYNKYREVPTNALKAFDNGKFKGTDINTMWRIKVLTEEFGMCGIGWYYEIVRTWTEKLESGDFFAFAEIKLYVKKDGEWSKGISGNGGNKLSRITKSGELSSSDEAYKMAITDALGVACRNLGIGANVYFANDRTKYDSKEEKSEKGKEQKTENNAPTNEQLKILDNYGVELEQIAVYFKTTKDLITREQVQTVIEKLIKKYGGDNK